MNDETVDLEEVTRSRRHESTLRDKNLRTRSAGRLGDNIKTKLNTAFIGAISRFEAHFGYLWGHGKKEHECTPSELEFRRLWESCRTEVLTNGNNQIRALKSEIGQYDILWNRHHIDLKVSGQQESKETK